MNGSFNHLRNEVQASLGIGRNGLEGRTAVGFSDLVGTQTLDDIDGVAHGSDASGIDSLQLFDEAEDALSWSRVRSTSAGETSMRDKRAMRRTSSGVRDM